MDSSRFDSIIKQLANGMTRRRAMQALLAGMLASFFVDEQLGVIDHHFGVLLLP